MSDMTCTVCPVGCSLSVDECGKTADGLPNFVVTGNRCPRGKAYALEEICAPKRTVTATCGIAGSALTGAHSQHIRRLPVKSTAPVPREKINDLLKDIYKAKVKLPVKAGDKIISNWQGMEIDIIATRTINQDSPK